jgi:hypothetical protein
MKLASMVEGGFIIPRMGKMAVRILADRDAFSHGI